MSEDQNEVHEWLAAIERSRPPADVISMIRAKLNGAEGYDEIVLRRRLGQLLYAEGNAAEGSEVIESLAQKRDDDVLSFLALAEQELYLTRDFKKAFFFVDAALGRAFRHRKFRRQSLGVQARIALASSRYDILNRAVEQILELGKYSGELDCAIETDIIDRAPHGVIDEELILQYRRLAVG